MIPKQLELLDLVVAIFFRDSKRFRSWITHVMDLKEMLLHSILSLSAVVAMVSFYSTSSYSTMLWIYLRGVVVGVVITVPDWAFFYRSPLDWLQPLGNEALQCRTQAMSRVKRTHSSKKLAEAAAPPHMSPFRLSSFQCLPTSAMLSTSGGSR